MQTCSGRCKEKKKKEDASRVRFEKLFQLDNLFFFCSNPEAEVQVKLLLSSEMSRSLSRRADVQINKDQTPIWPSISELNKVKIKFEFTLSAPLDR